jgi:hypothetical protein
MFRMHVGLCHIRLVLNMKLDICSPLSFMSTMFRSGINPSQGRFYTIERSRTFIPMQLSKCLGCLAGSVPVIPGPAATPDPAISIGNPTMLPPGSRRQRAGISRILLDKVEIDFYSDSLRKRYLPKTRLAYGWYGTSPPSATLHNPSR